MVSALYFGFEREKQYLLNFIYSLFLAEFGSFRAFSSCICEEKNLWRSLTAASFIKTQGPEQAMAAEFQNGSKQFAPHLTFMRLLKD